MCVSGRHVSLGALLYTWLPWLLLVTLGVSEWVGGWVRVHGRGGRCDCYGRDRRGRD